MSVAESISQRIKRMPKGKPFSGRVFAEAGSTASVHKALSRLVKTGQLQRVVQGVYMRPKQSEFFGAARPSPTAVVEVLAKSKGEKLQVHGAEAVRKLGLSTQTPMKEIYYTSGPSREIKVGKAVVHLRHAPAAVLQGAGTKLGVALSAMFYLGKEQLTPDKTHLILNSLSRLDIAKLKVLKMPSWMRSAVKEYLETHVA